MTYKGREMDIHRAVLALPGGFPSRFGFAIGLPWIRFGAKPKKTKSKPKANPKKTQTGSETLRVEPKRPDECPSRGLCTMTQAHELE